MSESSLSTRWWNQTRPPKGHRKNLPESTCRSTSPTQSQNENRCMPPAPPLRRVVAFDDRMPGRVIMFGGGADMPACATDPQVNHYGASPPFSAKRGSNCEGRGSPVLGRAQGWRFAPPPPAASALTPSAHRSFGRSSGRRDAPTVDHALPPLI